jgi:hypothetical protein
MAGSMGGYWIVRDGSAILPAPYPEAKFVSSVIVGLRLNKRP